MTKSKCILLLSCLITGFTSIAWGEAQTTTTTQESTIIASAPARHGARLWNLQEADILSVINEVSQETGRNFIVDPRVTGKITLISSKPLKQEEVYQVFLSILSSLGYSAIPTGNVIKIVPNMESGEQVPKIVRRLAPGKGDEVVVRVVALDNISATQMIPVLRPMLPQWSNISAYVPGNSLILIGRANTLSRIVGVIEEVDRSANSNIQIVPLKHASASQVGTVLNNLQNAARASGETPMVSIAVDDRSNSILLSGPKITRLKMRLLISQLDKPTSSTGNTEVIYLRYLKAKVFAPVLSRIAENILGKNTSGGGGGGYDTSAAASMNVSSASTQTNTTKEDTSAPIAGSIQYEENTNAIIVTAPPTLMAALKSVVAKLDIRPAQVLVEAIFAQIDESNLRALGIQWGGVGPNGATSSGGNPTDFPPLGAGVVGIINGKHLRAVLTMLENLSGVDILSTPQVVALDNQKATIEVGKDIAEQTGEYATTGTTGTVTPFNTIGRKKVTLKLEVTPQISLADTVRLNIKLQNDTLQNPDSTSLTPLINTSNINNSVIIHSNDILVLGGLISNTSIENINKVPILGDIPAVGLLFRQKTRRVERKNLMVFIKPVILHDTIDSNRISFDKYTYIRKAQANFREDLEKIGKDPKLNVLPPWKKCERFTESI